MFETFELGRFTGRPVRYFRFELQGLVWRYCTAPQDQTVGGFTYLAAQIDRSEIRQTVERAKDKIKITMAYLRDPAAPNPPSTQSLGNVWHPYAPSDTVRVICLAGHIGDTDPPIVEWIGIVSQPEFTDVQLTLTCEPGTAIAQALQQGPKWQKGCWKTVYSTGPRGCGLIAGGIPVSTTVSTVSGSDVTVAEFTDPGRALVGGTASWTTPEVIVGEGPVPHSANITAVSGTTITLDDVTGLDTGAAITLYSVELQTRTTLTAVDGLQVTAAAFATSTLTLAGGWMQWTRSDGFVERRSISAHAGDTITLLYGAADLAVGLDVIAIPGCEQTWAACAERFPDPENHYGGAIYKPIKPPGEDSMSWG
jgi:hypothetical protein